MQGDVNITIVLHGTCCLTCGVAYAFPSVLIDHQRQEESEIKICCPHGHFNVYLEDEAETTKRLREQQKKDQRQAERAEPAAKRAAAQQNGGE